MNIVLLRGELSSEPRTTALPSGSELVRWEVTTEVDGRRLSVPVVWFDAPATVASVGAGDIVVVAGTVRRRFWAGQGRGRASTTEVVATAWARPGRRRAVARLCERALSPVCDPA